jgi:hypothetical protein
MITELVARFLGLRGVFLLRGLRELLDGGSDEVTDLSQVHASYGALKDLVEGRLAGSRAMSLIGVTGDDEGPPAAATSTDLAAIRTPVVQGQGAGTSTSVPAVPSATGALLGSPILRNQGIVGLMSDRKLTLSTGTGTARRGTLASSTRDPVRRASRSLPAYIPARSFAEAVVDVIVPDATGTTTMSTIRESVDALPDSMSTFKTSLQALVKGAGEDTEQFRASLEHWYDNHMSRVAGWYKRRVAKITLVVGAVLVLLANINAVAIARTLYTDDDVRNAVSAVAAQSTACPPGQDQQSCLTRLETQLSAAAGAGVPIGWATVADCASPSSGCSWWDSRGILDHHGGSGWRVALLLVGFLITITALVPGARFWFDVVGKLGSLRTTGPRPPGASSS